MAKRGVINGSSDGLNNFWNIFWLYRAVFPTLVLNYTIITRPLSPSPSQVKTGTVS